MINIIMDGGVSRLRESDVCFYYMDRNRGGYDKSEANQLISNLKMGVEIEQQNPRRWAYRTKAIEAFVTDAVKFFDEFLRIDETITVALVPVFPSKQKGHPEYDNRLVLVANAIAKAHEQISVYDAFDLKEEMRPSHLQGTRVTPKDLPYAAAPVPDAVPPMMDR
jgi:hypothetical protein